MMMLLFLGAECESRQKLFRFSDDVERKVFFYLRDGSWKPNLSGGVVSPPGDNAI